MTKKEFYHELGKFDSWNHILINDENIVREKDITDDFLDWKNVKAQDSVGEMNIRKVSKHYDDYIDEDGIIYETEDIFFTKIAHYEKVTAMYKENARTGKYERIKK